MKNRRIALSILAIALVVCVACLAVACGEKIKTPTPSLSAVKV